MSQKPLKTALFEILGAKQDKLVSPDSIRQVNGADLLGSGNITISIPNTIVPIGSIVAFYGPNAPLGWLMCDGSTFLQNDYPELFALLNSAVLPDLRNRFLRGKSIARQLGSVESDSTKLPNNPFVTNITGNHNHTFQVQNGFDDHNYGFENPQRSDLGQNPAHPSTSSAGNHSHTIVSGGDTETRPINIAVNYIIKAKYDSLGLTILQ